MQNRSPSCDQSVQFCNGDWRTTLAASFAEILKSDSGVGLKDRIFLGFSRARALHAHAMESGGRDMMMMICPVIDSHMAATLLFFGSVR